MAGFGFRYRRKEGLGPQNNTPPPSGYFSSWNRSALLKGPKMILRGPQLIFKAHQIVFRAPQMIFSKAPNVGLNNKSIRSRTVRFFSRPARLRRVPGYAPTRGIEVTHEVFNIKMGYARPGTSQRRLYASSAAHEPFHVRLQKRLKESPTVWYPIPVGVGIAFLVAFNSYKSYQQIPEDDIEANEDEIRVKGPWQVHIIGALPLRTISRIYGTLNAYTLPVWFRVPGYKLYSYIFGVNLEECDPDDLTQYRSMSEFFMRRLKPGVRPIADAQLVAPSDGRVVNFGVVEGGRVSNVKGSTYSLRALLQGAGVKDDTPQVELDLPVHPHQATYDAVDEKEFANVNGIVYSLNGLVSDERTEKTLAVDQSIPADEQSKMDNLAQRSLTSDARVGMEVGPSAVGTQSSMLPMNPGNKLYFSVIYLAPGDYHRFHSPTNWVVERRRHFAGELFSVSPWMVDKLKDLFVLNERVALLGRWRHGLFSMVPVGATNVGSIRVNFDQTLRTNTPLKPIRPGTYTEAVYENASALLKGQPLRAGDEVGGFWLGSTIVLVFEAPPDFKFFVEKGERVKMGQKLGDICHEPACEN